MRQRLMGGAAYVAVVILGAGLGGAVWLALVLIATVLATGEALAIATAAGRRPSRHVAVAAALMLVLAGAARGVSLEPVIRLTPVLAQQGADQAVASAHGLHVLLALAVGASFLAQLARPPANRSLEDWAVTLAIPLYTGLLLSFTVLLRDQPGGLVWTALLLGLIWCNDSFAYLGGRLWGRRPLAPTLSPRKTVEGVAAGTAATVAFAAAAPALARLLPSRLDALSAVPLPSLLLLGIAVGLAAPLGDLSLSMLKRHAGLKDTGSLIPGHGGLLDRLDSLLFAAPVVYLFALVVAPGW